MLHGLADRFVFKMFHMQNIIAPTDFSTVSLNAVNYAADMAMATNSGLLILHANEPPLGTKSEYDETEIEEALKLELYSSLDEISKILFSMIKKLET